MPQVLDAFWTDDVQANERIAETYLKKGDDIVYIYRVRGGRVEYEVVDTGVAAVAPLDDKSWNKYRDLPPLGWLNVPMPNGKDVKAVYLRRVAQRARTHGISNNNVVVHDFAGSVLDRSRNSNVTTVFRSGSYRDKDLFPAFRDVFPLLRDGRSIALNPKFCLMKDSDGLVWLYRKRKRIALIPDMRSLFILRNQRFYREDIQAHQNILPLEIKEL